MGTPNVAPPMPRRMCKGDDGKPDTSVSEPAKADSPSNSEKKKPDTLEAPASDTPSKLIVEDKGEAFDAMLAAGPTDAPDEKTDAPVESGTEQENPTDPVAPSEVKKENPSDPAPKKVS